MRKVVESATDAWLRAVGEVEIAPNGAFVIRFTSQERAAISFALGYAFGAACQEEERESGYDEGTLHKAEEGK